MDFNRPFDNKHKNDTYQLTQRVFRDCLEQVEALTRIAAKEKDRRRLERGVDQLSKLLDTANDVIHAWEPDAK